MGAKVTRADFSKSGPRQVLDGLRWLASDAELMRGHPSEAADARREDARQVFSPLHELLKEDIRLRRPPSSCRLRCCSSTSVRRGRSRPSNNILWVETKIDILKAYEAVDHQAGAHQQQQGKRTPRKPTSALRPRPRDPPPDRPPRLLQRFIQIRSRTLDGRDEPEQEGPLTERVRT